MTVPAVPADSRHVVDMWFDPTCRWTWMTSRWVTEVAERRDVDLRWHVMSLAVLNEDPADDDGTPDPHADSWPLTRVLVAAARDHGDDVLAPLYTAIGTRKHLGGRADVDGIVAEALAEVGLPAELAEAAGSDAVDDLVRASHAEAMALVGDDAGSPVVAVDGVGYFGPVVSPAPTGRAALDLFDALTLLARVPGFAELKRARTSGPQL